jgi:uncharacterized protein YjiS (DUF1127 family)
LDANGKGDDIMLTELKSFLVRSLPALPREGFIEQARAAFAAWRHDRDLRAIEKALGRLSERQLRLIGMSHASLEADIANLVDRAEQGERIATDVLHLVDRRAQPRLLEHAA